MYKVLGKVYEERNRRGAIWQKHFVEKIVIYVRRNCRKNAEDAKKGQAGVLAVTVPADCCREKYHANCDTCQEAMSCTKRQQKDQMQQIRIAEAAAKEEKEVQKKRKSKGTGKMAVAFVLAPHSQYHCGDYV